MINSRVRSLIGRALAAAFLAQALSGCANNSIARDDEMFDRTNYCVRGGLPIELQFNLVDNPFRADAELLSERLIDDVIQRLDGRVSRLLRDAGRNAWRQAPVSVSGMGQGGVLSAFESALVLEIVRLGGDAFGVAFCGERESVGGAVVAAIAEYFSRAIVLEDGRRPRWVQMLPGDQNGSSVLMVLASLRLADPGLNWDVLLSALSGKSSSESTRID